MRLGRYMCERETGDDGGGACTGSRAGNWAITLQELQPSSRVKGSSVGRTDNTNDKEIIRGLPLLNLFLTHLNQLAMSSASLSVPFSSSEISTFPKASLHSSPLNSHPA